MCYLWVCLLFLGLNQISDTFYKIFIIILNFGGCDKFNIFFHSLLHEHNLRAPFSNTTSIPPNVATHNDDIFLRFDGIAIHERCVRPIPT